MRSWWRKKRRASPAVAALWGVSSVATISPLKKSLYAAEQQRADVARARRRWIREQGLLDPARLVFIDETATSTNMVRLRGRCPRGVRLVGYAPHGHWKTITFVAGLRHDRMVAPFVMEGAMNGLTFVEWVRPLSQRSSVAMSLLWIICLRTKYRGCARRLNLPMRRCVICLNTLPISTRSRIASAKSKRIC